MEYKINEHITVKLEDSDSHEKYKLGEKHAAIYINGERFLSCVSVAINMSNKGIIEIPEKDSLDEIEAIYRKEYLYNIYGACLG